MSRPDPAPHLAAILRAHTEADQPLATFRAVDAAMAACIGHKLFTILILHPSLKQGERYYTNQPQAYPVGGRKPVPDAPWMRRIVDAGEIFIGRDHDEIKTVLFDHELIRSLGCESVLNVPVRWKGQAIGVLNLLHEAGWYKPSDEPVARLIAHLALPAMMLIAQQ
jgi:hypothetical protein